MRIYARNKSRPAAFVVQDPGEWRSKSSALSTIDSFAAEVKLELHLTAIRVSLQSDRIEFERTAAIARCETPCPKGCTCDGTVVVCRALQLHDIPRDIPLLTTAL